jgi:hypothetical protein
MVFTTRQARAKAIDFLLGLKAKFNYGYNANSQGLYLLDVAPNTFKKNYLDLYLNFDNAFTRIKKS